MKQSIVIATVLLIAVNLSLGLAIPNQFLGKNKKKFVAADPLKENVIQRLAQQNANDENEQELVQTNQQSNQGSKSNRTFHRQDMHLWEEGVTKKNYDDFLTTKYIDNIEYLGSGYNLIFGNPLSTQGIDPGYTKYNAFDFVYDEAPLNSLTSDADYFIPNNVNLKTKTSCEISFDSKEINSMKEYEEELNVGVEIGYASDGDSDDEESEESGFSASVEYQQKEKEIKNSQKTSIISKAQCIVHSLQVSVYNPPKFSKDLLSALELIHKSKDIGEVFKFFTDFGTHATMGIDLGSQFGFNHELDSSEVQKMKSQGLDVGVAASGWGQKASVDVGLSKKASNAFKSALESSRQYSIGATPDADNNAAKWAAQSKESPMPIKGKFIKWPKLLKIGQKRQENKLTDKYVEELTQLFKKGYKNYCSQYLSPMGYVHNCGGKKDFQVLNSNNLQYFSKPNVPNGKSGGNYSKNGGYSNFSWKKVEGLEGYSIIDVDFDNKGNVFALASSKYRQEQFSNPKLFWKSPSSSSFVEFSTSSIGGNLSQAKYVTVANGKVGIAGDIKVKIHYYSYMQKALVYSDIDSKGQSWNKLVISDTEKIEIDETGPLISLKTDGKLCFYGDITSSPSCSDIKADWYSVNNGVVYYGDENGSYVRTFNGQGFKDVTNVQGGGQNQAGCITDEEWGYKASNYGNLYYLQKVKSGRSQQVNDGLGFSRVKCKSSKKGPLVIALNQQNQAYYRAAE